MAPKNGTSSGRNRNANDPRRHFGVSYRVDDQDQNSGAASDIPRSLLSTDGLAPGIEALTVSEILGDHYTWFPAPEEEHEHHPEYTPFKRNVRQGLPVVRISDKLQHGAPLDNFSDANIMSHKEIVQQANVISKLDYDQKDTAMLDNDNGDRIKSAKDIMDATVSDLQTPRKAYFFRPSSETNNGPCIADDLTVKIEGKLARPVTVHKLEAQLDEYPSATIIKHEDTGAIKRDMGILSPQEATLEQSVFGTGSWIHDNAEDTSRLEIEAFAALPFSNADIETELGIQRTIKPISDSRIRTCAGQSEGSRSSSSYIFPGSSQSGFGQGSQSTSSGHDGGHQKRLSQSGSGSGGDGDRDHPKRTRTDRVSFSERRLACPYAKNEPQYYRTNPFTDEKFMICTAGMGFKGISKLKEHLNRVHSLRYPCVRCYSEFRDSAALDKHYVDVETQCSNTAKPLSKGIMAPTIAAEVSKRGNYGRDPVEQWNDIYRLLFPNQDLPGPYHELCDKFFTTNEIVESFARTCEAHLPLFLGRLESRMSASQKSEEAKDIMTTLTSEFGPWIKELTINYQSNHVQDISTVPPHTPSKGSCTDSGYSTVPSSGCRLSGCLDCGSMSSPFSHDSPPCVQQELSSSAGNPPLCIDPSLLDLRKTDQPQDYGFPQQS